ncbi:MAG TPA: family 16 glycoside hydrolase [Candidatus Acidoferrales bacterium]|nr:family 16 glycoside hydrolase [Candidatus Acidoferrales bacterium]
MPVALIRFVTLLALAFIAGTADSSRLTAPPPPPTAIAPGPDALFSDSFSGDLSRWHPDRPGVWEVWHGMLRADLPDQRQLRSLIWAGDPSWRDVALDFDVCAMRGVDKGAVVRGAGDLGVGVDLRGGAYQDVVAYVRERRIGRATVLNPDAAWNHVRIETHGARLRVWVNGQLEIDRPQTHAARGRVALAAYTGGVGQCTIYFDNVVVRPFGSTPDRSVRQASAH